MTNLTSKKWWQAAGVRALKTFAQTAIAMISTGAIGLMDVDWFQVLSASALSALVSVLTSVAGLPEVEAEG